MLPAGRKSAVTANALSTGGSLLASPPGTPAREWISAYVWGHDSKFEVLFHLDEAALFKISPYADRGETSLLHVFDVNRARIQEAASGAYLRSPGRQNYHRLTASDLVQPFHRRRNHGQR